jgi:acylphosphatase
MIELYARFRGMVQGVGFRWTIVEKAEKLHLAGTVKNLPDGSVEVLAQGEKETLNFFIESVKGDCAPARVDSISKEFRIPLTIYKDFKIVR